MKENPLKASQRGKPFGETEFLHEFVFIQRDMLLEENKTRYINSIKLLIVLRVLPSRSINLLYS